MKRFVRSGSAELCVEDSQTGGDPVVCLHAGVTDRRMWRPQFDALATTHRMVAFDRRGFGETRLPPLAAREAFSHVDDGIAVLDALGIDQAVLMGCSQGGRIAIDIALAQPQRVRALVLVACSISGAPSDADGPFSPVVNQRIADFEAAEKRGDQALMNELEAQFWLDGPEAPAGRVGGGLRELFLAMNAIPLASGSPGEATPPPDAWSRLPEIRVPVLVVWGTLDFAHIATRMRELVQRLPDARAIVMEGVAHLPGLEAPQPFDRALTAFLEALPTAPARA